jgi:hypothetical protein
MPEIPLRLPAFYRPDDPAYPPWFPIRAFSFSSAICILGLESVFFDLEAA